MNGLRRNEDAMKNRCGYSKFFKMHEVSICQSILETLEAELEEDQYEKVCARCM